MSQRILAGKTATVTKSFICLLIVAGLWFALSTASAGPVDEAKKLLKDGKFDQVDTVLKEQLAGAQPSAEALKVSLDAAMAQGKVITAQRRITSLLKATSNADLDLVYRGAMISEQVGERRMALSRYLTYVRKQKGSDDRMRHALEYLVTKGKFPAEYKKYVSVLGANDKAWKTGMALMNRLIRDQEATAALDVAGFMMDTFKPDPKRAGSLADYLGNASHRGYFGDDQRKRYIVPLQIAAKRKLADGTRLAHMCEQAYRYLSAKEAAEILEAIHQSSGDSVNERCLILFDRLRYSRDGGKSLALAKTVFQKLDPIYRSSKIQGAYAGFVARLHTHRDSFINANDTVFDKDTLAKLLDNASKKGAKKQIDSMISRFCERDAELRTQLARKYAADMQPSHASWVIGPISGNDETRKKQINAAKPFVAAFLRGRDVQGAISANAALMDWYNKAGDKNALLSAAANYMATFPADFDSNTILRYVWQSKLPSLDEKIKLLKDHHAKSGPSDPLNEIINNRLARDPALRKEPSVRALTRGYRRKGSDPVMQLPITLRTMHARRRVSSETILAALLRAYNKPLPSGAKAPASTSEIIIIRVLNEILPQVRRLEQVDKLGLGDRLTPGPLAAKMLSSSSIGNPYVISAKMAAKLKGSDEDTMKIWTALSYAKNPKGDSKPLFAKYYGTMGSDNALRYLVGQMGTWHGREWRDQYNPSACWTYETFLGQMEKLAATKGFKFSDPALTNQALQIMTRWQTGKGKRGSKARASKKLLDAIWGGYLAGGSYSTDTEMLLYAATMQNDPTTRSAWIDRYTKSLGGRTNYQKLLAIDAMMRTVSYQDVEKNKEKSDYLCLFAVAADICGKLKDDEWSAAGVHEHIHRAAGMLANNTPWRTALKDQAKLLETGTKLNATFEAKLLAGAPMVRGHNPVPSLCEKSIKAAAAKSDWPAAISATRRMAEIMDDGRRAEQYKSNIISSARALQDVGASEILYAFLRQIGLQSKLSSTMGKEIAILRARAAKDISGLIAVSPSDASYPLHLAAQALLLGNETRAWELSRDQSKLFASTWEGLDANFVAWYVRATFKQKNYEQVTTLGRSILQKESSLDAETAAAIYLALGDVQRALENNDAAVEIYKKLQTSDRYKDTRAGRESRYRNVLLMIATGAYGDAEDALALMIESPSIDEQAEAYFLLAKLADQQKEYARADKYLTQVRARIPDHIEAAFLEGELRAKAPSMLARGEELEIGVVAMETIAVPGRELIFRLQDSNLAIAKGSSWIPITVETSTGKDKETVKLVLSGTGKNMFKGTIVTALGRVSQGDRILQLRGDDVVSYRIEDEFQKSHELNYKQKELEVKADGELSASAGRILSDLEVEQREVERKLALARGEEPPAWTTERKKSVRPGSPIYVRVIDFDRDVTDNPDKVTIAVKTTGGDRLDAVELTETSYNSGVFMGNIPTSIPLPKGLASDTFAGKKTAWLINSKATDIWSSLDDGEKPKWVEADTMTSHMVSTVKLAMPEAQKVKEITLSGSLAEDLGMLATYPLAGQQHGLRMEVFADDKLAKPVSERVVNSVSIQAPSLGKDAAAARLSGMIVPTTSGPYEFQTHVNQGQIKLTVGGKVLTDKFDKITTGDFTAKLEFKAGREYPFVLEYAPKSNKGALSGDCRVRWKSSTGNITDIPTSAIYPGSMASRKDDLALARSTATATGASRLETATSIRDRVKANLGATAPVVYVKSTSIAPRAKDEAGSLSGTFVAASEQMMAMKIVVAGLGGNSRAFLLIDGRQELGGKVSEIADKTANVFLRKGPHTMELVYRSAGSPKKDASVSVQTAGADKKFAAVPWQWFSADHTPELADAILPNGLITLEDNVFTAKLRKPIRLRTARWNFVDFAGKDISAQKITVIDAAGKTIIPVEKDFTTSLSNDTLEIAPGDRISLTYVDKKNLQGDSGRRNAGMGLGRGASLSVGFDEGEILLAHEELVTHTNGEVSTELFPARRCSAGDSLTVVIEDQDIDLTPKRDKVNAIITTSSGERVNLEILEQQSINSKGEVHEVCHTGKFVVIVKLLDPTKPAPKAKPTTQPATQPATPSIKVKPGDEIVVRYLDTENNDGVPMDRVARLTEGGAGLVGWSVMRTRTELVPDTSAEAIVLQNDLRRISNDPALMLYRQNILHLSPKVKANQSDEEPTIDRGLDKDGLPICSVRGPLQFSLLYPKMARNTGSTVRIAAVAESEIAAAKAEKRKIKGAIVTMDIPDEDELEAGRFYGELNLQIGVPGDKLALDADAAAIAADEIPVKTIIARGDDVIQLRYKDPETGETNVKRLRLLADGRLEVLERTMRARKLSIHLGQKFHLRVADPDRDTSNDRDVITVAVKSKSGDSTKLELTETMIHSGIFTGSIEPRWIKDRSRDEKARKAEAKAYAAAVAKAKADAKAAADAARKKAAATTKPASAPASQPAGKPAATPTIAKPITVVYADFGDTVAFQYVDNKPVSTSEPRVLDMEGVILEGANGSVALFSKEYKDPEMAVKTAFLTAEAMFAMAKDMRKKKRTDLAKQYISHGKGILEEALKNYPNTTLVAQGEYLVATLAQELGNYNEAVGKYSEVVQRWTKSSYAPKALYRIGQCYEAQGNFERASEEYVRVTYLFPNSPEVPQATLRLGRHYLKTEKYAVAGRIFEKFHDNNPKHRLASKTLFLSGECYRLSERYKEAIGVFKRAGKLYADNKQIRSESLYWHGVCARELKDYVNAYRTLKRLTWDYPESQRAADARKLLGTDELQTYAPEEPEDE